MADETRVELDEDVQPPDKAREDVKRLVKRIMSRKPEAIVIFAQREGETGPVVTAGAVGSPLTINELILCGIQQIQGMIKQSKNSGENG